MDYPAGGTVHGYMPRKKYTAILFAVIAIGWVYNFLQVAALTPGMSLSQFGPGMNTLAFLNSQPPTAMSSLISSLPLCSNFGLSWTVESVSGSILMWFGMVLAMMVPTLLSPSILHPVDIKRFIMFLFGYVCIWLVFCIIGVAIQWGLQAYGVLGASLSINNSSVSAALFFMIGGVQLSKPKLASLPCWPELSKFTQTKLASFSDDFRAGLNRGGVCGYRCLPLMSVMFVFGLMNLVAMAFLTIIIYLMANATTGWVARVTGIASIVYGMLFLGLRYELLESLHLIFL